MTATPNLSRPPASADATADHSFQSPLTAPIHTWFTSPARSNSNASHAKELPLHLIQLILEYLDDAGDLARITRTSRLFYYMTLPRLYENVSLRSYSEIRYIDGRPEGYGSGSPFAMGLNTLVSRSFTDYVQNFKLLGDWREHDKEDYKQGRVPDNSMVLQIVIRAALDRMKNLKAFAWELNTAPLQTVYQGLVGRTFLASLTIRCQGSKTPRPTTVIPPLPNLKTLVVYQIDPLCYPDDISLILLGSKKLENLKLHWSPRMRDTGEESVNLLTVFGRCLAAKYSVPIKRLAVYNLYTRFHSDSLFEVLDPTVQTEVTVINSMGSSDPMTIFLDHAWKVSYQAPVPANLKMLRIDNMDKESAAMIGRFHGLERAFFINNKARSRGPSKPNSAAATPDTPSNTTPGGFGMTSGSGTPIITENQCRSLAGDYLAVIQRNHRTMRNLLLSDRWKLSDDAFFKLCQSCPNLEQLGFSCLVPPLESLRQMITMVPKLWAIRFLIRPGAEFVDKIESMDPDMHVFAVATEFWRPEYKNLKYLGMGENLIFKLGKVYYPPKARENIHEGEENSTNAKRGGPIRKVELLTIEDVRHIDIWGMDTTEFDPNFP